MAAFSKWYVTMQCCNFYELHKNFIKKETQPDTFTFALVSNLIHSIIPVAGTNEREPMITKSKSMKDRTFTMFVQCTFFFRPVRKIVIRIIFRVYRTSFKKMNGFIKDSCISSTNNIATCR